MKDLLEGYDTYLESYESKFTYHGFRYIEVNGFKGALKKANITAITCKYFLFFYWDQFSIKSK